MRRILVVVGIVVAVFVLAGAMRDIGSGAALIPSVDQNDHLLDGVPGLGGPKR